MIHTDSRNNWSYRGARGLALAALLLSCGLAAHAAGGLYSASGHASATSGVNRQPTLYSRGECGHCHEAHASQDADTNLYPYQLFAREENACLSCHDGTVTYAANAKTPLSGTPGNTATAYYKHPIASAYSGTTPSTHRAGETLASAFGGTNRHAECTDCHNPHAARNNGTPGESTHTAGGSSSNRLSGALLNVTGIVVSAWQAAGAPFSSALASLEALTSNTTNYEWQVCFKCHSSYTTLPTYSPVGDAATYQQAIKITSLDISQVQEYRDVGQAFNPNNPSYHSVVATGKSSAPAGSFVAPWTATSTMYCSDCHSSSDGAFAAAGPHGSDYQHVLERKQSLQENTANAGRGTAATELCFKCHSYAVYVTTSSTSNTQFRNGTDNLHSVHAVDKVPEVTCYTCHDAHGTDSKHLLNFNSAVVTYSGGDNSMTAWHETTTGGGGGYCNVTCHGGTHDSSSKTYSR